MKEKNVTEAHLLYEEHYTSNCQIVL